MTISKEAEPGDHLSVSPPVNLTPLTEVVMTFAMLGEANNPDDFFISANAQGANQVGVHGSTADYVTVTLQVDHADAIQLWARYRHTEPWSPVLGDPVTTNAEAGPCYIYSNGAGSAALQVVQPGLDFQKMVNKEQKPGGKSINFKGLNPNWNNFFSETGPRTTLRARL